MCKLARSRPGKRLHNHGKTPFFMGKFTISMVNFHSYVKLPEGNIGMITMWRTPQLVNWGSTIVLL